LCLCVYVWGLALRFIFIIELYACFVFVCVCLGAGTEIDHCSGSVNADDRRMPVKMGVQLRIKFVLTVTRLGGRGRLPPHPDVTSRCMKRRG